MFVSKEPQERFQFQIPNVGTQQARLIDIIMLGEKESTYNGKTTYKDKIKFVFVVEDKVEDFGHLMVSSQCPYSTYRDGSKESTMVTILSSLAGSWEDVPNEVDELIGAYCNVQIIHNEYNGRTYAFADKVFLPSRQKVEIEMPEKYIRHKDRSPGNVDSEKAAAALDIRNPHSDNYDPVLAIAYDTAESTEKRLDELAIKNGKKVKKDRRPITKVNKPPALKPSSEAEKEADRVEDAGEDLNEERIAEGNSNDDLPF